MPVRITVDGESWLTDDLTFVEIRAVEKATGVSWLRIDPVRWAEHLWHVMVQLLSRSVAEDVAIKRLEGMTAAEIGACISVVPDDRPVEHTDGVPVVDPPRGQAGSVTT